MGSAEALSGLRHAATSVRSSPSTGKREVVVVKRGVEGIEMVPTVKLNNGYHFPVIGLGTYNVSIPTDC